MWIIFINSNDVFDFIRQTLPNMLHFKTLFELCISLSIPIWCEKAHILENWSCFHWFTYYPSKTLRVIVYLLDCWKSFFDLFYFSILSLHNVGSLFLKFVSLLSASINFSFFSQCFSSRTGSAGILCQIWLPARLLIAAAAFNIYARKYDSDVYDEIKDLFTQANV